MIIIKGELPDLNTYIDLERGHWSKAAVLKKQWTESIYWEIKLQKPRIVIEKISFLMIDWYVKDNKKDADNIVFAKKFILDAMVLARIIPNDSRKYLSKFIDEVKVDKNNPRVEIRIF